jgi:uncharacterized protein with NAD-binding domain and iron-sulfur cluster
MAYISGSKTLFAKITKKGHFLFRKGFSKKKFLTAYISNLKIILAKITKKGNFLKRKLYARKFGKMPEKS